MIRRPITADAAIMHPDQPILTLKGSSAPRTHPRLSRSASACVAGNQLQIYNISLKRKIKETTTSEPIVFWKWISTSTLALVTQSSVFHWTMEGAGEPALVFARHEDLAGKRNTTTAIVFDWFFFFVLSFVQLVKLSTIAPMRHNSGCVWLAFHKRTVVLPATCNSTRPNAKCRNRSKGNCCVCVPDGCPHSLPVQSRVCLCGFHGRRCQQAVDAVHVCCAHGSRRQSLHFGSGQRHWVRRLLARVRPPHSLYVRFQIAVSEKGCRHGLSARSGR